MATWLVTGANRGIGLSLCKALVGRGERVIAACRHVSDDLRALDVRIESLDVTDQASIDGLAEGLEGPIDVLINNAGVLERTSLDDLDPDSIRRQFDVNALGPVRVTAALREHLPTGGKVAIITSRMGSIGDNTSGSHYGYRMSKAAVNMAGVSLAHDLRDDGVAVALLHPGWVRTDMTGGSGNWGPDEAASALLERIDELSLGSTGSFWHAEGQELPW